jgi:RHS repeat-associated protein
LKSGLASTQFNPLDGTISYSFENVSENWFKVNHYDDLPDPDQYPWNQFSTLSQKFGSLYNLLGRLTATAFNTGNSLIPYNRTLPAIVITTILDFQARHSLITGPEFIVESGGSANMQSGQEIRLMPGFRAEGDSRFRASIEPALLNQTNPAPVWQAILYNYDLNGDVSDKFIFTQDRETIHHQYLYDNQSRLLCRFSRFSAKSIYQFYDYNKMGQLIRSYTSETDVKPDLCEVEYGYNPAGTIKESRYNETAPGVFMEKYDYQYTIRDWLERIGDVDNLNKAFSAEHHFDKSGNIINAHYYNREASLDKEYKYNFGYDQLYRLKAADYSYFSGTWNNPTRFDLSAVDYDPNGNLLHLERAREDGNLIDDIDYLYNGNNRLTGIMDAIPVTTETWDAEDCQLHYDANGNLNRITSGITVIIDTIEYNHLNLPVHLVEGDGDEIFYRYNREGQRIYKEVDENMPEYYIMDGATTVAVASLGEGIKYWNIFAPKLAGKMTIDGDKYYYIKDYLGSIRSILNEANQVVESHDYYPFGLDMPSRSYISPQITQRNKELFTGKERDGETGWDYFGARYYDPSIGRWMSVDPHAEKYPSLNPYNYCENNPLIFFDLDGKGPERDFNNFASSEKIQSAAINNTKLLHPFEMKYTPVVLETGAFTMNGIGMFFQPARFVGFGMQGIASLSKINNQYYEENITRDLIGDISGNIIGAIGGRYIGPFIGYMLNYTIDNSKNYSVLNSGNLDGFIAPVSTKTTHDPMDNNTEDYISPLDNNYQKTKSVRNELEKGERILFDLDYVDYLNEPNGN